MGNKNNKSEKRDDIVQDDKIRNRELETCPVCSVWFNRHWHPYNERNVMNIRLEGRCIKCTQDMQETKELEEIISVNIDDINISYQGKSFTSTFGNSDSENSNFKISYGKYKFDDIMIHEFNEECFNEENEPIFKKNLDKLFIPNLSDEKNVLRFLGRSKYEGDEKKKKIVLLSKKCECDIKSFLQGHKHDPNVLFYDIITYPNAKFHQFNEKYQRYLITLYFVFDHPDCVFSILPKEILSHKIIPFIPEEDFYLNLKNLSEKKRTQTVFDIIEGIAKGMFELHTKCNLIMRELHPEDIFVVNKFREGEPIQIKIRYNFHEILDHGGKISNSQYTAPELILPQIPLDDDDKLPYHERFEALTDVFSFGILMFEIITCNFENPYYNLLYLFGEENNKNNNISDKTGIAQKVSKEKDFRPEFDDDDIPNWYKSLCNMCWGHKAIERPSFERICHIMNNLRHLLEY